MTPPGDERPPQRGSAGGAVEGPAVDPGPGALTVIVPTVGRSDHLLECVRRLRSDGGDDVEIVLVAQGGFRPRDLAGLADRVHLRDDNPGFTGGCNHALTLVEREFVALVNDDLLVERGWTQTLLAALAADPGLGSVQGLNLQLERPHLVDGFGIGWNRFWRPVQLGHGAATPEAMAPQEIFGVSATAAIYRTAALRDAVLDSGDVFDARLESYYEDVDLAIRLRRRGWQARALPSARALHAGAESSRDRRARFQWLAFSNRLLVSARLFGRSLWRALPLILIRDVVEVVDEIAHGRLAEARASLAGWLRALRLLGEFAHPGPRAIARRELQRFRVRSAAAALERAR